MKKTAYRGKLALLSGLALCASALTSPADYSSTVLGDGPMGFWKLNETGVAPTPNTAVNTGTFPVNGLYMASAVHPVTGALVSDPSNGAAQMPNLNGGSGGSSCVRIPWAAELNANAAFSVEFWAKPAFTNQIACPASSVDFNTDPRYGWLFYQTPPSTADGNGWFFRLYRTGGNTVAATAMTLSTNQWYHVVGTFDGVSTIKLYVNGVPMVTNTLSGTYTPNVNRSDVPMTFGCRGDGAAGNYGWGGTIDEPAYYTNLLSDAEILAHYQAGTTASPATPYATLVQAQKPAVYCRLNEAAYTLPVAANSGTLGAAANGSYTYFSTTTPELASPTYPGFAADNRVLQPSGTNGLVRIPALNLNSSTVTFECWIKRNGAQSDYAGVFFHRGGGGTATGIDFKGATGYLGYHWNDQGNTYDWESGLTPPDGAWTYVALAVAPDKARMYMYDGTTWSFAENVVSHPAQAFADITRIGADNDGQRLFNGLIDNAAIYGKTLTEGQLRTHALAGFGDPVKKAPTFVSDPPTLTPAGTIYSTTPFSIAADVYGEPPLTFEWSKDGSVISGATTATFTRTAATLTDSGTYTVKVSNAYGSVTSAGVVVTVNPAVPPTITTQPANRLVYPNCTAQFTVSAEGTTPFTYQWKHAGTNLPGATNATLVLANCTAAETGAYTVGVTNVAGGLVSASATLSLTTPLAGSFQEKVVTNKPVAYWRLGETSGDVAYDYAGGNDATYFSVAQGQPGFVLGDPNGAAGFDGANSYITTGKGLLNNRSAFTVMGWMKRGATHSTRGGYFGQNDLLEFGDANSGGSIEAWIDAAGGNIITPWPWADDKWGFIVLTGNGSVSTLYIDGQVVGTQTASVTSYGTNRFSFNIGGGGIFNDPAVNMDYFQGFIDEVALYDKALSAETIETFYSAGLFGGTTPPFVTLNPLSQTVVAGSAVTLTGKANGSIPISYQWKKNGVNVPGATTTALTLNNVYFTDAGSYTLAAVNGAGSISTAPAVITVMPVPAYVNQTNDLVLHLRFDGNYLDTSGRANDATAPAGEPPFIAGRIGQAVQIASQANANYLTISDAAGDLSFYETNSFTLSCWLKYTGGFNDVPIIGNAINSTWQIGWVLTDSATAGKFEWSVTSVANTGTWLRDPVPNCPTVNDGAWHNVVLVLDRAQTITAVYVDGVLASSWSISGLGSLANGYYPTIGSDPTGAYGAATFDMDDLGIWKRAFNAFEAAGIYAAGQAGKSFDVTAPIEVNINQDGTNIDIIWQSGTLYESTTVNGTYTPVSGATAPFYRTTATGQAKFYRVQ